jgi:uncharacterized protein
MPPTVRRPAATTLQRRPSDRYCGSMTALVPRHFTIRFDAATPRHWLPGNEFVSSFLNAYSIMVPANEAFYIRTLLKAKAGIAEPTLRATIDEFIGQEAQHGSAHKQHGRMLDAQGYRYRVFERVVATLAFRIPERLLPLSWRVSMVGSVEHINAFLGHEFLAQSILADADPAMRALMEWHFAEEIEHKQVAFDVLRAVAPSYGARLAGFMIAVPLFFPVLTLGAFMLLWQDRRLHRPSTWSQLFAHWGPGHRLLAKTARHLFAYVKPGFDPSRLDDRHLADAVIGRYQGAQPPVVTLARQRAA